LVANSQLERLAPRPIIQDLQEEALLPPKLGLTRQIDLSLTERLDKNVLLPLVESGMELESETGFDVVSV
jgi:hypothetical protein